MKKNHIIAAALAILLAGCSAENTASTSENVTDTSTESVISSAESQASDEDEKAPEQNSNGELLKVSSFDGKTLTGTRLVAIDAARTARQVDLHGMEDILIPSHKACVRMCSTPNADYRCVNQGSQVHISTIHAEHDIQMAHQVEFL